MRTVLSRVQERIRGIIEDGPGKPRLLSAEFQNEFGQDLIAEFSVSSDRLVVAATVRCSTPNNIPSPVWVRVIILTNNAADGFFTFSLASDRTLAATTMVSAEDFLQLKHDANQSAPLLDLPLLLDKTLSLAKEAAAAEVQRSYPCDA